MSRFVVLATLLALTSGASGPSAQADEPYAPASYWFQHGFHESTRTGLSRGKKEAPTWPAHSLSWPVHFQDAQHSIGNSMAEFQSYGDGPYYHGGLDLRVARAASVVTPVGGRIEAGHYGYSNNPDGSSIKYWHPWPNSGDPSYFEVAVITDNGFRFEFHHLDENSLSPEVLNILKKGGGSVPPATPLGKTIPWPGGSYHHTHYNIVSASGVFLNPEYYSPLLADRSGPQVKAVLASFRTGGIKEFGDGNFNEAPAFFAIATLDHTDGDVYEHPPALAEIKFENGTGFSWDFRERLWGPGNTFPPIWDFFVKSIQSPTGQTYLTRGGYGEGLSVVRVPVPQGTSGNFILQVADQAGNAARFKGHIKAGVFSH